MHKCKMHKCDDVERGVCVCVGQVLSTLQGPNVPKRGIKTKMSQCEHQPIAPMRKIT